MRFILGICFCLFLYSESSSQTLGTVFLSENAQEKYTLINPNNGTDAYLIDNCGFIIKQWASEYRPGLAAYLTEEGDLYRSGRVASTVFSSGGLGGVIEKFNWSGDLEWSYSLATDSLHLHHDFYVRDNGNLFLIVWELIDNNSLQSLGRINIDPGQSFYSERIVEIDPSKNFKIIWEWRAFDHLVQNSELGVEAERRLDINLNQDANNNYIDWLHINSIDFDESGDLIMLSCNAIDELIIIERTEELETASGSIGGKYGLGGDILFRWGNPSNFTTELDGKTMFSQHDINFIGDINTNFQISVFNNVRMQNSINYSTVDLIEFQSSIEFLIENFNLEEVQTQGSSWTYNASADRDFYSKRMSSAHFFNGHWIVCASDEGRIFEIDRNSEILWEYVNPVGPNQIFQQGEDPFANTVFQANAYPLDYFNEEIEIEVSMDKIELNGGQDCIDLTLSDIDYLEAIPAPEIIIDALHIRIPDLNGTYNFSLYDLQGRLLYSESQIENDFCLDITEYNKGIYLIILHHGNQRYSQLKYIQGH